MDSAEIDGNDTYATIDAWSVAEVVAIVVLFFVYAGRPAPDVNEAHYLCKAKQFWQPQWCAGDVFLESRDAHAVFFWLTGWTTTVMSLASAAWAGRVLTWVLLAIAWQRLVSGLKFNRGFGLLSAGMSLCLWEHFHLAGEWVVGGFEAKGFALALLFLALRSAARAQWAIAYMTLGAASSFHVLLGGWGVLALTLSLALRWRKENPRPLSVVLGLVGGGLLALPGLLPAVWLMAGADGAAKQLAAEIYVRRLAHHLEIYHMAPRRIGCFAIALSAWGGLWLLRHRHAKASIMRIQWIVAASVAIGLVGVGLDYFSIVLPIVHRLLRFYWFRLSDVMVPLGIVLFVLDWLRVTRSSKGKKGQPTNGTVGWGDTALAFLIVIVASTLSFGFLNSEKHRHAPAFIQGLGRDRIASERLELFGDWQDVCRWANEQSPQGSLFLTPTISQTFCWYANRGEVAVWKNVPQDAESMMRWRQMLDEIRTTGLYPKPNDHSPPSFVDPTQLAKSIQFDFLIGVRDTPGSGPPPTPRIAWPEAYRNGSFIVYRKPTETTQQPVTPSLESPNSSNPS